MRYLSIDIEATGLKENDLIIEFAMIPFSTEEGINEDLARSFLIKCPSFDELLPKLDTWVIENNKYLIQKSHENGIQMSDFKQELKNYLASAEVKKYFNNQKIILFGKSMNAIDLPFLSRDLGWDFIRDSFSHRQLDLSGIAYALIDLGLIPIGLESGSAMMKYLQMGNVAHTALEDARNTAIMYLKLIEKIKK